MPTTTKNLPFMVGADPEFSTYYGDMVIDAEPIIKEYFTKNGIATSERGFISEGGEIGYEGTRLIEIRPKPNISPAEVTKNIGLMIADLHTNIPFISMSSLSLSKPAGGHIHLDIPTQKPSKKIENRITRILATYLIPILMSEHRVCTLSRYKNSSYGRINDIRWGENNGKTVEVRGLTSEWITSPHITESTFAYIGVIWNEIKNNHSKLVKQDFILHNNTLSDAIQEMIFANFKMCESILMDIKNNIQGFELYEQYKTECDFILSPKKVLAEKEAVGWNLVSGWNLDKNCATKITRKSDLLSETIVKKGLEKINLDNLTSHGTLSVLYNNDKNISIFAEAIQERIAGLNWVLKNTYILFGMKENINGYLAKQTNTDLFWSLPYNMPENYHETITKMEQRFKDYIGNTKLYIEPKTGRVSHSNSTNRILVGIPYTDRQTKNTKNLLSLMWNIEKGSMKLETENNIKTQNEKTYGKEPKMTSTLIEPTITIIQEPFILLDNTEILSKEELCQEE